MGSKLVSDSFPDELPEGAGVKSSAPLTYSEIIDKAFPYYLSIGMSYEQYYEYDCTLVKAYREAEKLRRERTNQEMWLNGYYTYNAIYCLVPVLRAFSKATKAADYPSEPFPITQEDIEQRKKAEQETKQAEMMAYMQNLADSYNQKFRADTKADDE